MSTHYTHRIPQTVIDDLIVQTDIYSTVSRYVSLKKVGLDYHGLCPFHKENTASFTVNPAKQFFYCFGCGAGGNVMDFLRDYLGRSFLSQIQDMADDAGVDLKPYLRSAQGEQLALKILPALKEANSYFQKALNGDSKGGKNALEYLRNRGIDEKTISLFALGYASYGNQIVKAMVEYHDPLIEAGILGRKEEGDELYSRFRDRIVMPIRDTRGKTIGLSGRVLEADVKPKYLNSKETPHFARNNVLYGLHETLQVFGSEQIDHMLAMEGQFDVMACVMNGLAAVAGMGSSLSAQQLRLLLRYSKRVTFIFDGDHAGLKAMLSVTSLLLENLTGHEVLFDVVMLPEGEDPHSMLTKDKQAFLDLISTARPWMDAMLAHLPEAVDLASDKGRIDFASAVVELAQATRDPLLRYQVIEKASVLCKMPCEVLNEKLLALPEHRSGQARQQPLPLNDSIMRLTRMVWDEPEWSKSIEHPELWVDEGDELTALLGNWVQKYRAGDYDAPYSETQTSQVAVNPELERRINLERREKGGSVALARMLFELPSEVMTNLMREHPENSSSLAAALSWHITGLLAGKAMQELSKKASSGTMTEDDRKQFTELHTIRKVSIQRSRAIDT